MKQGFNLDGNITWCLFNFEELVNYRTKNEHLRYFEVILAITSVDTVTENLF